MENLLDLGMRRGSARRWSHLLEVRDLLEPGIAAIAAERATKEDIAAMSEAIAAMDASSGDTDTYISGDDQFHLMLAKGTQNELVLNILEPILGLLHDQREGITRLPGVVEEGQYHHKRILNAIMSHDPESAREAMRDHLAQVRRLIAKTNPRSE